MRRFMRPIRSSVIPSLLAAAAVTLGACGNETATSPDPDVAATRGGNRAGNSGTQSGGQTGGTTTVASRCNGVLGAVTVDEVFVPNGATCTLNGTRVRGNAKVSFDGSLAANGARIDGSIQADDARAVTTTAGTVVIGNVQVKRRALTRVENTVIDGDLQIEERGASVRSFDTRVNGNVQVVKADRADLARLTVNGDVQFTENLGALRSEAVTVEGNMQVVKNRGGVTLFTNRVRQVLECKENVPAPVGAGNVAGEKTEQCRGL
jgi:hypothetical protein